jgi:hypothetical protein
MTLLFFCKEGAYLRLSSHVFVADYVANILEELVGVSFNRKYLILGAKMPDIQPLRRMEIHSPQIILPHFEREYNRIVLEEKKINRISYIIGLLTHYISDGFCYSHNIYTVDMKKHIQYEYYLNSEIANIELLDNIKKKALNSLADLQKGINSIGDYIKNQNKKYLELVKENNWSSIIRIDLENAIIHSIALLAHFVFELQQVRIPALLTA